MAQTLQPMLASPAGVLPSLEGWTIEPKWDGFRLLADVTPERVRLWSRNGIDKAAQFPEVSAALKKLSAAAGAIILDGEVVAVDAKGNALRFQALQQRGLSANTKTAFIAFDVLATEDGIVLAEPWTERRKVLEAIVSASRTAAVRRGASCACGSAGAKKLLVAAQAEGWEGLIVKQMNSPYLPGKRSLAWRKIKLEREQEFLIGGYTLPTAGSDREHFGALLVGYYDAKKNLIYAGKIGTGYTRATLASLGKTMAALRVPESPFANAPRKRDEPVWIKPKLIAQIRYNEMTRDGILRQPVFLGLRDDKSAASVKLESGTSSEAILKLAECAGK